LNGHWRPSLSSELEADDQILGYSEKRSVVCTQRTGILCTFIDGNLTVGILSLFLIDVNLMNFYRRVTRKEHEKWGVEKWNPNDEQEKFKSP
jgi:hypothetical protein